MFHELAHIVLGHIDKVDGTDKDDETEADKWAGNMLIEFDDYMKFKDNNDYSVRSIKRFAKMQGIAPGIVVGRLQNDCVIKYSMLNELKEKYEIC